MTSGRGGAGPCLVHLRSLRGAPNLSYVEHIIRYMSWTFVFGAVATLLYTSFKPFWHELLAGEFPPEQIQGTMIESRDSSAPERPESRPDEVSRADAPTCTENQAATEEICVAQNP